MVVTHLGLVRPIALALLRRLPAHIELADLVQAGMLGLIQACGRWDASRGVPFECYARHRIRGAMLDSTRRGAGTLLAPGTPQEAAGAEPNPEEVTASLQRTRMIRLMLLRLPQRDREVLLFHLVDGISMRGIGQRLRISKTRACQLKARAIRSLRAQLSA
jgi:RNA polymerase sigma factor (sigma-70 family)